jgi:diguanylate cyclase (GGDEF)-like protein
LGSRIRVSGICILDDSNPFDHDVPFDLLVRTYDDIAVVANPSLLTVGNLIIVVSVLLLTVLGVGARGWILERRVRRQTSALAHRIEAEAALERQRSRILEDINGSKPLPEIIEQITELVSLTLDSARCWCQLSDEAPIGQFPAAGEFLRIVREEISVHAGTTPSSLFVGFDPCKDPSTSEAKTLAMGAGLAALAIETRRLYSDLVHRSQFDLLTEIHNRFSLDRHLDSLIRDARMKASVFGLIYVDLDEFKQVNDECGHQVGDLYLQQVAIRMEHVIRSVDLLARIGGDEFAVLVPDVRSRTDVEEIALRIERSFDEPVPAAEYLLHASASVGIAVYPADALTKDGLLHAADSAMYKTKNTKKQIATLLGGHREHHSTLNNHS